MPINWNEVDKLKLEYIQNKEAAKTKYEEDFKVYKEEQSKRGFFDKLFNCLEKPEKLFDYYTFPLYKDCFYCLNYQTRSVIKIANLSLPSELENNVIKYLNPTAKIYYANNKWNKEEFLCIDDNEENRKKLDKVVALIEKYLDNEKAAQEARQKEAEAYIDNYINNKDTK